MALTCQPVAATSIMPLIIGMIAKQSTCELTRFQKWQHLSSCHGTAGRSRRSGRCARRRPATGPRTPKYCAPLPAPLPRYAAACTEPGGQTSPAVASERSGGLAPLAEIDELAPRRVANRCGNKPLNAEWSRLARPWQSSWGVLATPPGSGLALPTRSCGPPSDATTALSRGPALRA